MTSVMAGLLNKSGKKCISFCHSHRIQSSLMVISHSDNLIFDEGKLIGCIDVGRVGIADRYQDLAILWNCLGEFSFITETAFSKNMVLIILI